MRSLGHRVGIQRMMSSRHIPARRCHSVPRTELHRKAHISLQPELVASTAGQAGGEPPTFRRRISSTRVVGRECVSYTETVGTTLKHRRRRTAVANSTHILQEQSHGTSKTVSRHSTTFRQHPSHHLKVGCIRHGFTIWTSHEGHQKTT